MAAQGLEGGVDNIIMALKHNHRVCQITLWHVSSTHQKEVLAAMNVPFPELTDLKLKSEDEIWRRLFLVHS